MRDTVAPRPMLRPLMAVVAVVAAALLGTIWLWAQYGTAVFFETIRTGFVACFG